MTFRPQMNDKNMICGNEALIFIVDDEQDIRAILSDTLREYRFNAVGLASASACLEALERQSPAVILLDLGLPDMDGMDLINRIRQRMAAPIIVLSARAHASDRIMGLEIGADDYVVKPFDPREVVARVRSLLRRSDLQDSPKNAPQVAQFAGWTFSPGSYRLLSPTGEETFLSTGEASLLEALLRAPQRVLSRDYLMEHACRDDTLDRAIDVRISRIRKRLSGEDGQPIIRTVYGSGYMLSAPVRWSALQP